MSLFRKAVPLLLLPLVAALGACASSKPKFQEDQLFSNTASPYSRNFDFPATDACEAARRGLLSQGYMTTMTHTDAVDATKNFQPASDSHIVVEVHVVCTAADASNTSVVYVNAVQNGYALKKSDTSASVGLSIFGSLSLPIRTNSDAMVKISSETIQSGTFYDQFFELVGRYLHTSARSEPVPHGSIEITPLPPPVSPSPPPPVAVVTPPAPAAEVASRAAAVPIIGAAPATGASAAVAPAPVEAHAAASSVKAADTANAAAAATATVETTTPVQPATATAAATQAVAETLPGIGEPPMLTAPANDKVATAATAPAPDSAAHPAGAPMSIAQTHVLPASNGLEAVAAHEGAPAATPSSGTAPSAAAAASTPAAQ